jgi:hypothetical protein
VTPTQTTPPTVTSAPTPTTPDSSGGGEVRTESGSGGSG